MHFHKPENISFSPCSTCTSSVSQRRYELSRAVFGSESFSLLGNRKAVSVDYMPVLRSICRFQRAQQQREEPVRWVRHNTTSWLSPLDARCHIVNNSHSCHNDTNSVYDVHFIEPCNIRLVWQWKQMVVMKCLLNTIKCRYLNLILNMILYIYS